MEEDNYKLTREEFNKRILEAQEQAERKSQDISFTQAPDPIEYREAKKHLLKKRRKKHGRQV